MIINGISIGDSPFFGENLEFKLSPKLNCIMGGRGSGKTTILTLINWVFNEDQDLNKETLALIKANLGSATFNISLTDNLGNTYTLSKTLGTTVLITGKDNLKYSLSDFKKKANINFFSAGTIEKIGVDPKERLKMLDGFIGEEIEQLKNHIGIMISQLKQNEIELKNAQKNHLKTIEDLNDFENVEIEMKKAKEELSATTTDNALKEKFEMENKNQATRAFEKAYIEKSKELIQDSQSELRKYSNIISQASSFFNDSEKHGEIITEKKLKSLSEFKKIESLLSQISDILKPLSQEVDDASKMLTVEHVKSEALFSELRQTIAKHRDIFQKINLLSQKETAQKIAREKLLQTKVIESELRKQRLETLEKLTGVINSRSELRRIKASEINLLLDNKVKILIKESALNENFQDVLRLILNKGQMRFTNAETKIIDNSTPAEFLRFLKANDVEKYASKHGIEKDRVSSLFNIVTENQLFFELESCLCEDSPNFFLAVEEGEGVDVFKATEDLSTGQRCTAVLPIVFAITNHPLLIDQPEDNLDNKYIAKSIHQIIRSIKEKRQLIFVTHNPNIPVISDAEHNIFLSYNEKHSEVIGQGSTTIVKDQIIDLLEGGKAAFTKRKVFYGY